MGNKTVFAPNNDAFSAVPSNVSSNTDLLTQILAYHILNTTYTVNGTQIAPNHTIAPSVLQGGNYSLPGNRSQPLVLARNSTNATSFQIIQATSNITATGPVAAANLLVYVIPQVISLPPTIAALAGQLFPGLAGVIQSSGLLAPIAASPGVTIFAPNDAAIGAIQGALGQLNATQIQTVLANHVINGTVVYSTNLASANYTSAAGQPFTFISNSTGAYVQSANSTARILQSDIIVNNGVVHLIDSVLVNTASNPAAASSAFASGTSAAAATPQNTAPVTATSPAATSGAASSRAAGDLVASFSVFNSLAAAAVGVVGLAIGGGLVLA